MKWALKEKRFKTDLLSQAGVVAGQRVLDLGCGTATLTMMIKRSVPEAEVFGVDADEDVLQIARQKSHDAGLDIDLRQGMSFELPYPDRHFDRVLSSLVFHHLSRTDKLRTLREALRVLRSNGQLHVADWTVPLTVASKAGFFLVRMLDGFSNTRDNAQGLLPDLFVKVGFSDVLSRARYSTLFGDLALYSAKRET